MGQIQLASHTPLLAGPGSSTLDVTLCNPRVNLIKLIVPFMQCLVS